MDAYAFDWLNLLIRWVHLITGIAWIGASFYFVWLDNSLLEPRDARDAAKGVGGELWAVHGGGFYHVQKYRIAPAELPAEEKNRISHRGQALARLLDRLREDA